MCGDPIHCPTFQFLDRRFRMENELDISKWGEEAMAENASIHFKYIIELQGGNVSLQGAHTKLILGHKGFYVDDQEIVSKF